MLVACFAGWNDAGDAATMAAGRLEDGWGGQPFATIDPEEFHNFTEERPVVRLTEGLTREIKWPEHTFSCCPIPGTDRDAIFLVAVEPQLRWRTYCGLIIEMAQSFECSLILTLGALLSDTPHTRPVRVSGTAHDAELALRLGLTASNYEGPTGIVGVLHDQLTKAGLASASLWAQVPHYVGRNPSPPAALALVERAATLLGAQVNTTALQVTAAEYLAEIDDVVAADDEAQQYVRGLEAANDAPDHDLHESVSLAGAEQLAAEVERFLRHQEGR